MIKKQNNLKFNFPQTSTPCFPSGFGCWPSTSKWTFIKTHAFIIFKKPNHKQNYHFYTSFMSVQVQKMTAPTLPKVNRDLRCRGDFKILNNNVEWCVSEDKDSRCFRWNSAHSLSSREFTSKTSEVLFHSKDINSLFHLIVGIYFPSEKTPQVFHVWSKTPLMDF